MREQPGADSIKKTKPRFLIKIGLIQIQSHPEERYGK
jgi:hypothetical protein